MIEYSSKIKYLQNGNELLVNESFDLNASFSNLNNQTKSIN
jgi:hypothetical protein